MTKKDKVSNERKNLHRLAGEFLVASRLTQRGYMVTLQWGTAIGYDILVFDKHGDVAFLEVKSSASYSRRWVLQKKYAHPKMMQSLLAAASFAALTLQSSDANQRYTSSLESSGRRLTLLFLWQVS